MADNTGIQWTDASWNPVTGCDQVSAGCDNCYAMALSKRLKAMGAAKYQNDGNPVTSGPGFGVSIHPETLGQPAKWRSPKMIFVNSMSDLFHAKVPLTFVRDIFEVMESTPRHTYQVLTKRPLRALRAAESLSFPPNLWMGTSVEDADSLRRVEHLRKLPAAIKFLSCEPLIGPLRGLDLSGIDWVIVGGESGPRARVMNHEWVREVRDLCLECDIPFFFKQWGGLTPKAGGRDLDGVVWDGFPSGHR